MKSYYVSTSKGTIEVFESIKESKKISVTVFDVIGVIKVNTATEIKFDILEATQGDIKAAMDALCDGECLIAIGYMDDDKEAVEVAYDELREELMEEMVTK